MSDFYHKYIKYKTKYLQIAGYKNNIELIRLKDITKDEINELHTITQTKDIMNNIGSGETWDKKYINKLKESDGKDYKSNNEEYYQYYIKDNNNNKNKIIGYISLRPLKNYDTLQVRIFVFISGVGYGRDALELLTKTYNKDILAVVSQDNIKSNKLFSKWVLLKDIIYYFGKKHNVYKYVCCK